MKLFGKILSFTIVLLILIFSILSVCGFSYYFGDNKVTLFKGIGDLNYSTDIDGGFVTSVFTSSDDEISAAVSIIEERAAAVGLVDYRLYVEDSTGEIKFIVPKDVNSDFSADEFAYLLTSPGYVTLRPDNNYTDYGVDTSNGPLFIGPKDTTEETIILNSSFITKAVTDKREVDGETSYYLNLHLNDEGTTLLSQITDPALATGTSYNNSMVSLWIDDRMISYNILSEHLEEGILPITDPSFTPSKTELYAAIVNTGPFVSGSEVSVAQPVVDNLTLKTVTLIAGILLLLFAFYALFRYRLSGFISVLCVIFQFTLILSILTGFFPNTRSYIVNIPAVCGFVSSLLLTAVSCILISQRIKNSVTSENLLDTEIKSSFKKSRGYIFDITCVLIIVSLIGTVMFGASSFTVSVFGNTVNDAIYKFCHILLLGSVFNIVSGYLLPVFLIRNFGNIRLFAKPSMFGGKK